MSIICGKLVAIIFNYFKTKKLPKIKTDNPENPVWRYCKKIFDILKMQTIIALYFGRVLFFHPFGSIMAAAKLCLGAL